MNEPKADQIRSPAASGENERLAALACYNILDTSPEAGFDDITKIAAHIGQTPIALISMIDAQRQFFKSTFGAGDVRETPLEASICFHALLESDLFVVPDLTADSRFANMSLVAGEPHLRFYAGARLQTPEGVPFGMVCILDTKPRPEGITPEQGETLRALARQTMAHMELRRAVETRDLVSREMTHRVKNVFAIVSSIAGLSARGDAAALPFVKRFGERIRALSHAHDMMLAGHEKPASIGLRALISTVIEPYQAGGARITLKGVDLDIGARSASSIAMAVHELATNATKYGALSAEGGHVDLVLKDESGLTTITWLERGGPPIAAPPTKLGFGSTLIRNAASDLLGTLALDWTEAGLTARIAVPRANLFR